jgi:hypothetical protein
MTTITRRTGRPADDAVGLRVGLAQKAAEV